MNWNDVYDWAIYIGLGLLTVGFMIGLMMFALVAVPVGF